MARNTYQNNLRRAGARSKRMTTPKGLFVIVALILLAIAGGSFWLMRSKTSDDTAKQAQAASEPSFDKKQFSLTDPASPWVVVNKKRPLQPTEYEPSGLRQPSMEVQAATMQLQDVAATALEKLAAGASAQGIKLVLVSAYRSYDQQKIIYDSEVRGFGQTQADRESARPGHSEHQTGLAADLGAASGKCEIEACFADTAEGKWLAANAYKYGFILRYAEGKEHVTGYMYEPWHLRYVGVELATEMHRTKAATLEEFFGLAAAPSY